MLVLYLNNLITYPTTLTFPVKSVLLQAVNPHTGGGIVNKLYKFLLLLQ